MTVHFTGPVLFAGKDGQRKWFADLPVSNNPDYVVYMDDFTGIAIDKTNDWTELKDTNATVAIGADVLGGVVVLTSEATTDNDGASIQGNEIFAVAADRDVWFETKLFITGRRRRRDGRVCWPYRQLCHESGSHACCCRPHRFSN
jgi:hypothetical protein